MSDTPHDPANAGDLDARLRQQERAAWDLRVECLYRAAQRTAAEVRRVAKAERRLVPFLGANFHLMNVAQNLLEPALGRDAAVENIALLEDPDRARAFQGDFDPAEYEHAVQWMSACSYDNLAVATATAQGYNSEGMQACIADGIRVCRQTGKLKCVACFREYATAVHRAADDLDMALHHARTNVNARTSPDQDRRYVGAKDEADLLLLGGRLEAAWDAAGRALSLADTFHSPKYARRGVRALMETIALLAGRDDWPAGLPPAEADAVPAGEDPRHEFRDDLRRALADCRAGDPAAAVQRLATWDKWLTDRGALHDWFEVRLRLVAATRLAGQADRAAALAKPLNDRATAAHDYLTLHRLGAMLDGTLPTTPVPAVGPYSTGPYASSAGPVAGSRPLPVIPPAAEVAQAAGAPTSSTTAPAPAAAPESPGGALRETIDGLVERLQAALAAARGSDAPPDLSALAAEIASLPAPDDRTDARRLLHLAGFIAQAPGPNERLWAWAEAAAAAHPNDGPVLNLLAALADVLRSKDGSPLADTITAEAVGAMYRRSLDMDPNQPNGFGRAAGFYLSTEDYGEAERCLARGFRLDRSNASIAGRLADLYAQTDRPGDALAVLDMCLREGAEGAEADETPDLLWQAGMLATNLDRHQSALTYLDRLAALQPDRPGVQYYRAVALLGLNRPADAAAAIEAEAGCPGPAPHQPPPLHLTGVRAAAAAALGRVDDVRQRIADALAVRLADVDYLSPAGVSAALTRTQSAAESLPADDPLRAELERRLLASGLMPDDWFERRRKQAPAAKGVHHYVVSLLQPLDDRWADSPARLAGQDGWPAFVVHYGVLAADEQQAEATAAAAHRGLHPLPATVESVRHDSGPYTDHPGVTWQSLPEPVKAEDDSQPGNETEDDGGPGEG